MTKEGPKLLGEITKERHVLGELISWEERAMRHPPQPSPSSPNEGTSVGGQLWEHGKRAIVKGLIISALNARSWQSSRINEGMIPKQCHAVHCNSQQVEGSAGWDDTQVATCTIDRWMAKMKGAEKYITKEISRRGGGQFGRHQKALVVQYQKRRRRTHPQTRPEDGLWPPSP